MKKIFFSGIAASALFLTACGGGEEAATTETHDETTHEETVAEPVMADYTVDVAASTLEWKGYEAADMEGHYHIGTVGIGDGTINTKDGMIEGGSFTINMAELGYTEGISHGNTLTPDNEMVMGLWEHIKSPAKDIFMSDSLTTATFTINSCDDNGINGTLNVLGQDVMVTVPGMPAMEGDALTHTTDWFDVDLSSAVPFFGVPEGAEGAPMKLSMKLNLTASK